MIQRGSDQAIDHSYPDYLDLRDRNRSFDGLAAYRSRCAGLNTGRQSDSRVALRSDAGTTSMRWVFIRILGGSFMRRMSMARTARRISC